MVILCDAASRVGIAWQLLQQHKDGSLRIVANGGQALTPAQEKLEYRSTRAQCARESSAMLRMLCNVTNATPYGIL